MDVREAVHTVHRLGFEPHGTFGKTRFFTEEPLVDPVVFVGIEGAYRKADYPDLVLFVGTNHTLEDRTLVFGAFIENAGAWFDKHPERGPGFRTGREFDGGVIVWFEEPTRAAIMKRLSELAASRARSPAARVVAGASSASEAWRMLVEANVLPRSWLEDARRTFRHRVREVCDVCGGYAPANCYGRCDDEGYLVSYKWREWPETVAECAAYAEVHELMALFEMLALDLVPPVASWIGQKPSERTIRWTMFARSERKPRVPDGLWPAWYALREAVPEAQLAELSVVSAAPADWPAQAQRAWKTAVERSLRVPKASWGYKAECIGVPFADLPDPFVTAHELADLPFDLFEIDETSIELWAWS